MAEVQVHKDVKRRFGGNTKHAETYCAEHGFALADMNRAAFTHPRGRLGFHKLHRWPK